MYRKNDLQREGGLPRQRLTTKSTTFSQDTPGEDEVAIHGSRSRKPGLRINRLVTHARIEATSPCTVAAETSRWAGSRGPVHPHLNRPVDRMVDGSAGECCRSG